MRNQIVASAEKVSKPVIQSEAPHYQAALTFFSDKTTIEEGPDGSKLVVRKDDTSLKNGGPT